MYGRRNFSVERIIGIVFLSVGSVFLIPGIIMALVNSSKVGSDGFIVGSVFGILGFIFFVIGLVFYIYWRKKSERIKRLTSEGDCYDAEIVNLYPGYQTYNGHGSVIAECVYKDKADKKYIIKSKSIIISHLMMRDKGLKARVWVNRDNPRDYYIDLYIDTGNNSAEVKYDFDFR